MDINLEELDPNLEADQIRGLYTGLNNKVNEFKILLSQMVSQISQLKSENQTLKSEKSVLLKEIDALQNENIALNEDRDNIRTELREVRNENDILLNDLKKRNSVMAFAKNLLESNTMNGIVNSLPAFSEQMALSEQRPTSMTNFSSVGQMDGMRLETTQSKEETYHSTRITHQTSDDDYYDAVDCRRSSVTNGGTNGVRPKLQQNVISSTINSERLPTSQLATEIHNKSFTTGITDSTNFYFDSNNNLKLNLIKVPIGQLIDITVSYVRSPSDFWAHINSNEVNDYLHVIQVKQTELRELKNSSLSAADIELGMYCAAIYSYDGYWYRAQIIDINYENPIERDSIKSVIVLFIDWGNTEERPLSKIMKLSAELTKRRQAINCYIQECTNVTEWPEETRIEFEEIIKNKRLCATFCKPHKMDDRLESLIHPIDLVIPDDNEGFINIRDFLTFPNRPVPAVPIRTNPIVPQTSKEKSSDTVVCVARLNGHSNPNISGDEITSNIRPKESKKVRLNEEKSKSNQNCAINSVPESPNRVPKSLPLLNGFPEPYISDGFRIPPPIIPDTMEGLIVETSHPLHPSHIYFHIRDTQVGNAQFEDLDDQLNAFYSKYNPQTLTQSSDVTVGSFWVTCFTTDNRWYRCRVIQKELDRVLVNYVDWGNEEWTVVKNLMQLTRQFAIYPAMAVKSRLANIFPKGSDDWSEESLQLFAELIYDKPLTAFIIQKPVDFGFDSFLDVFLWTTDDNDDEVLINWLLVNKQLAETDCYDWVKEIDRALREKTPPQIMSELIPNNVNNSEANNDIQMTATTSSVANTPVKVVITEVNGEHPSAINDKIPAVNTGFNGWDFDRPPIIESSSGQKFEIIPELPDDDDNIDNGFGWDPIREDAESVNNNYSVRPNDAGIATIGFKPKERMICKFYGTAQGCRMDDICQFVHIEPNRRFEINDTEEVSYDTQEIKLSVGAHYIFKVSNILNPYHFYGYLPFGIKDLNSQNSELTEDCIENKAINEITQSLKNFYSNPNNIKDDFNIFPTLGSLVAYKDISTGEYLRGEVIDINYDTSICKIFSIDFGFEVDVKRRSVFNLGKYFVNQHPAQAILCSLAQITPLNSNEWTEQAVDAFIDWVSGKLVCLHIMYGQMDGKYYVDLIDRENDIEVKVSDILIDLKFAKSEASADSALTTYLSDDEIYDSSSDLD